MTGAASLRAQPACAAITREKDIIGHTLQCAQLLQDIVKRKTAHAYLFCGKKHLGKYTVAQWFTEELLTQEMNFEEKKQTQRAFKKNMHPDLLTLDQLWIDGMCTDWNVIALSSNVRQEHRAKAKIKTDTIGIDDVRALQERLHETSQGGRTCCLIRSLERLHITAANALLNILEEPPPHVTFCCTTQSLSSLPQTIVSRMRVLHFSPVPNSQMLSLVRNLSDEDRSLLLCIAQGAPGVIIQSMENPDHLRAYRQTHSDALRFLESPSLLERFRQVQSAFDAKEHTPLFLQQIFLHLQRLLRSGNAVEREKSRQTIRNLLPLLHTLQSNANKPLLATHAALCCSPFPR
jgi:hypothetical protein